LVRTLPYSPTPSANFATLPPSPASKIVTRS
jgi:hypothetical protein